MKTTYGTIFLGGILSLATSSFSSEHVHAVNFSSKPEFFLQTGIFSENESVESRDFVVINQKSSGTMLTSQLGMGAALGIVGGLVGGRIGGAAANCNENSEFLCGLGQAVIGSTLGLILGSSTGVYVAGKAVNHEGTFGSTLVGSLGGTLGGGYLALKYLDGNNLIPFFILIVASPVLGGMLGYHLSDRVNVDFSFNPEPPKINPMVVNRPSIQDLQMALSFVFLRL